MRQSLSFTIGRSAIVDCLDLEQPGDALFGAALTSGLRSLDRRERASRLCGVTGHVAESVIEVILVQRGWSSVWHFEGPGRHGVDLLLLAPTGEHLFAVEVKGTLQPSRWPRIRRGEIPQMTAAWLDKNDNPAMRDWDLAGEDVYGAVAIVNFHDLAYKVALTEDFARWHPVAEAAELDDLSGLNG